MTTVNNTQVMTMISAVQLVAKNDVNGNPRRLWVVSELVIDGKNTPHSNRLAVIEEGYEGTQALRKQYPTAINNGSFEVSPTEYRRWAKMAK